MAAIRVARVRAVDLAILVDQIAVAPRRHRHEQIEMNQHIVGNHGRSQVQDDHLRGLLPVISRVDVDAAKDAWSIDLRRARLQRPVQPQARVDQSSGDAPLGDFASGDTASTAKPYVTTR